MTDSNTSRTTLLPYALALLGASLALQISILLNGSEIGVVNWILFIATDAFLVWFNVTQTAKLAKLRFGSLVAHAIAYVAINAGFAIHAATLAITNSDALRGDADMPVDGAWFGFGMLMPAIWGIWFCFHAIASIRARGFEDIK